MKKLLSYFIGAALFLAGYYHTRRHSEYVTAQSALASPAYATTPDLIAPTAKPTFAFRLIKPS